jgi:hypothetical protein
VISRQLGSHVLLEDREVSMLNSVLEFRICGWLDSESVGSGGDGMLVGSGYHFIFFASKFFVFFLAACGSLLLREGLGGRGLYVETCSHLVADEGGG